MQPMEFGLRLRRGHSILDPPEHTQVKLSPGIHWVAPFESNGNDKLSIGIGEPHTCGHDADDAPRYAVNADGLPDHIRILAKSLLPVSVANHDDKILSGLLLVSGEEASYKRMNAQGVKGVGHDRGAAHPVRGIGPGNIRFCVRPEPTDSGEGSRMFP